MASLNGTFIPRSVASNETPSQQGHLLYSGEKLVKKSIASYAIAALIAGGAATGAAVPAQADVGISVGFGGPAYYGYDYQRPCSFYFRHDLPAPRRCYRDYYGYYGSDVYISDGFVFRNRGTYGHWKDRDDFRHWRGHDWNDRGDNDRRDRHGDGNGWHGNGNADSHRDRGQNGNNDRHDQSGGHDRRDDGNRGHY